MKRKTTTRLYRRQHHTNTYICTTLNSEKFELPERASEDMHRNMCRKVGTRSTELHTGKRLHRRGTWLELLRAKGSCSKANVVDEESSLKIEQLESTRWAKVVKASRKRLLEVRVCLELGKESRNAELLEPGAHGRLLRKHIRKRNGYMLERRHETNVNSSILQILWNRKGSEGTFDLIPNQLPVK